MVNIFARVSATEPRGHKGIQFFPAWSLPESGHLLFRVAPNADSFKLQPERQKYQQLLRLDGPCTVNPGRPGLGV